ncbi:MAG: DUF3971 domain-containing protein [Pseudobdellovibrionaceae bacterium]
MPDQDNAQNEKDQPEEAKDGTKNHFRVMSVLGTWMGEALIVLLLVILLTIALTGYRLHKGPLDVSFALSKVQAALTDPERGITTTLKGASLHWPDFNGPLLLILDDVTVLQKSRTLFSLNKAAVALETSPLFIGQVKPEAIILKEPSLRVIRRRDGSVSLTFGRMPDDKAKEDAEAVNIDNFIVRALDPQSRGKDDPLFGLEAFEIQDARVSVLDIKERRSWAMEKMDVRFLRAGDEAGISLATSLMGQKTPTRLDARARLEGKDAYVIEGEFRHFLPFLYADTLGVDALDGEGLEASGHLKLRLSRAGELQALEVGLRADDGTLYLKNKEKTPLPLDTLRLDYAMDAQSGKASLTDLEIKSGTMSLSGTGAGTYDDNHLTLPLALKALNIPIDLVDSFWTEADDSTAVHEWVVQRLSKGMVTQATAKLELDVVRTEKTLFGPFRDEESGKLLQSDVTQTSWAVDAKDPDVAFDFKDLAVEYREPLWGGEDMTGSGKVNNESLDISITGGHLKDIKVIKGQVLLSDINVEHGGMASIDLSLSGTAPDLLRYISLEPINLGDKLEFKPEEVKGTFSADVNVGFPLIKELKNDDVGVKVNATLNDVSLPRLVKDMTVTGGPFTLAAADGILDVKGSGALDGTPVTVTYQEKLNTGAGDTWQQKVSAQLTAPRDLRDKFGAALDDYVSGSVPLDIDFTQNFNRSRVIKVKADLTPAKFVIDPLDYGKPEGEKGELTTTLLMSGDTLNKVQDLNITLFDGTITGGNLDFAQVNGESNVTRATFSSLKLPGNDFSLNMVREAPSTLAFTIRGNMADARPFLDSDDKDRDIEVKSEATPLPPRMKVDGKVTNLRLSENGALSDASVYVDIDPDGMINVLRFVGTSGEGAVNLNYLADAAGVMQFRFKAGDAGATLKALGWYENMVGGLLEATGTQLQDGSKNDVDGSFRITNFKVVKAPGLARLLNAASINGLSELLGGKGMGFTRLESRFQYLKRPLGAQIRLTDGRTSGAEVGLTFAGVVDLGANTTDIEGTVVPLSTINNVIGQIPLIGDILTGGGALFAATYTMKGPTNDPKVSINPLSALTPGILRKILFEGETPVEKVDRKEAKEKEVQQQNPPIIPAQRQ